MDSRSEELSINCENVDSFTVDPKTGRLLLTYYVPHKDLLGRKHEAMERKTDSYECGEGELLIKTFNGIRSKVMQTLHGISQKKSIQN